MRASLRLLKVFRKVRGRLLVFCPGGSTLFIETSLRRLRITGQWIRYYLLVCQRSGVVCRAWGRTCALSRVGSHVCSVARGVARVLCRACALSRVGSRVCSVACGVARVLHRKAGGQVQGDVLQYPEP